MSISARAPAFGFMTIVVLFVVVLLGLATPVLSESSGLLIFAAALIAAFAAGCIDIDAGFGVLAFASGVGLGSGPGAAIGLGLALVLTGAPGRPMAGGPSRRLVTLPYMLILLALLSWGLNGLPVSAVPRWFLPIASRVAFLTVVAFFGTRAATRKALVLGLLAAAVLQSVIGVLQATGRIETTHVTYVGGLEDSAGRAAGLYDDPNYYALDLAITCAFAIALLRTRSVRWIAMLALPLSAAGILASLSRTGFVALGAVVCGFLIVSLLKRGPKGRHWGAVIAVALLMGGVLVVAPAALLLRFADISGTGPNMAVTSAEVRIVLWEDAIALMRSDPLVGVGPDQTREYLVALAGTSGGEGLSAHSTPLDMGSDLGVPGLLLWAFFLWVGLRLSWRARRALRQSDSTVDAVFPAMLGYCFGSLFVTAHSSSPFWITLALLISFYAEHRAKTSGPDETSRDSAQTLSSSRVDLG